jgi:hypothetical protein
VSILSKLRIYYCHVYGVLSSTDYSGLQANNFPIKLELADNNQHVLYDTVRARQ